MSPLSSFGQRTRTVFV